MSRLLLDHPYGQTPRNMLEDFDWVGRNRQMLIEQYGQVFIVVYQQQVIGTGDTYESAVQDAEMRWADKDEVITPIVEKLFVRHPFLRAKPKMMEG